MFIEEQQFISIERTYCKWLIDKFLNRKVKIKTFTKV